MQVAPQSEPTFKAPQSRYPLVDYLRGTAVALMIFFHFCYDLDLFAYVDLDFSGHSSPWYMLPRLIVLIFLLAMGMSLVIVHTPLLKLRSYLMRLGLLVLLAAIVSLSTFIMFPDRWIYFGTLHCIALCSVLALPFLKRPRLALGFALAIFIPELIWDKTIPWFTLGHPSMDYIAPFPWFGVVLTGIFAAHQSYHKLISRPLPLLNWLAWLGRHSLKIYLLHQPLLYGAVWCFKKLS